jgi:hypothetical protein
MGSIAMYDDGSSSVASPTGWSVAASRIGLTAKNAVINTSKEIPIASHGSRRYSGVRGAGVAGAGAASRARDFFEADLELDRGKRGIV